jgi:hypothetical protein
MMKRVHVLPMLKNISDMKPRDAHPNSKPTSGPELFELPPVL